MRLTVLVDNNTYIDQYHAGEPAACYYLEDGDSRILFDAGYSDVFLHNARQLGVDASTVDTVVISHGHNDHTGGLRYLPCSPSSPGSAGSPDLTDSPGSPRIRLVAHPGVFDKRYHEKIAIGSPVDKDSAGKKFDLNLTKHPASISEHMVFLGEIPSYNSFERTRPMGIIREGEDQREDYVLDDSAVAYKGEDGLFIITGCSHSGICNIVEHAKRVCEEERIAGILGGFHLFGVSEQLKQTIRYFMEYGITNLYPCHCVSFAAKAEIHRHIPIHEVGVGLTLDL